MKLSRNCKRANLSNLQNGSQRQAQNQINCAFSFRRKRTAWNKRKDKTMTLDKRVTFAKSDKGSFYNQKE